MRRILYSDVVAAASAIRIVERDERQRVLDRMINRAHCADKFRKRFGKLLPGCGDGSLITACSGLPKDSSGCLGDRDFAECMLQVFSAILAWRTSQAGRGGNA